MSWSCRLVATRVRLCTHYTFKTNLQGLCWVWTENRQMKKKTRSIWKKKWKRTGQGREILFCLVFSKKYEMERSGSPEVTQNVFVCPNLWVLWKRIDRRKEGRKEGGMRCAVISFTNINSSSSFPSPAFNSSVIYQSTSSIILRTSFGLNQQREKKRQNNEVKMKRWFSSSLLPIRSFTSTIICIYWKQER